MKTIGIVGGGGPLASALLLKNIVLESYKQGCSSSGDLPHITLVNYPFDFESCIKSSLTEASYASKALQDAINTLEASQVDLLAIACNTLHLFLPYVHIKKAQLVDISLAVLHEALDKKLSKVLVLGSPRTMHSELYKQKGVSCVIPSNEHQLTVKEIIQRVLAGQVLAHDAHLLQSIINTSKQIDMCDGVILGCTELSVLAQAYPQMLDGLYNNNIIVLDTIRILAQKLIKETLL